MNLNIQTLVQRQFDQVDNAPLVVFRMLFGFLIFVESAGAIFTGWVKETFIIPDFTFTIIGFEWLQPLPGSGMYFYFALMALLGLMVMLGYQYRLSIGLFTLLWTISYFMQKSSYNNHYYLLILLCLFMWYVPAHGYASLDARRKNAVVSLTCSRWCISIFKIQLWIVFSFAAISKLYPGWLQGDFIDFVFVGKQNYPVIGQWLQENWVQKVVVYGGIIFDLVIIYFLLWRRTRKVAFGVTVVFHLFNSAVFQIGIFPYLMIALCIFFFDPFIIRKKFLKKKPISKTLYFENEVLSVRKKALLYLFGLYFLIQFWLPLRHHLFAGDVIWTEEGHRMAWRMMLRTKGGSIDFLVKDVANDSTWVVQPRTELNAKQVSAMASKPDMIWQYSKRLRKKYQKQGMQNVQIFARSRVRLNGGPAYPIINENQDLAAVKWQSMKHSDWILSPDEQ